MLIILAIFLILFAIIRSLIIYIFFRQTITAFFRCKFFKVRNSISWHFSEKTYNFRDNFILF